MASVQASVADFASRQEFKEAFDSQFDPKQEYRFFVHEGEQIDIYTRLELYSNSLTQPHENCGKWRFLIGSNDESCAVYKAIDTIREAIFTARHSPKTSVAIPMFEWNYSANNYKLYIRHCNPQTETIKVWAVRREEMHREHQCSTGFEKATFTRIVEPALRALLASKGCTLSPTVLPGCEVEDVNLCSSRYKEVRDIPALHIRW